MKKKIIYQRPALQVITLHTESPLLGNSVVGVKDHTDSGKTVTQKGQVLSNEMEWDAPAWTCDDDLE